MEKAGFIRTGGWLVGTVIVCAFVARICHTVTGFDCVQCRTLRMEHQLFGFAWETSRDTEFTEWHRVNIGAHRHQWERFTCLGTSVIIYSGQGCGIRHPVCEQLPSVFQKTFAERAGKEALAKFFKGISSTNRTTQIASVEMALRVSEGN